ncbi:hypothetical protein [Pelagicoccus sp. SDUM812005]|uniref:hypothetical protein n=1 Tax=Pelagicoccus sp. SDUM812005 TaxID=3041257 RepID=UPI00280E4205|nr:hypothetical protein [Pelagicoccus sp. SDUM812005]MDQ8180266.1 hypothetical protein [Pelagicoccus sp. SDUM812005]
MPCIVYAADFHVAVDGSDSNSGAIDAPFLTIAKASSAMQAGDRWDRERIEQAERLKESERKRLERQRARENAEE